MKFEVTTDLETKNEILKSLRENKDKYGERYCPCTPTIFYNDENAIDYICPCRDFRETKGIGEECHCGLYIKTEL